MWEPNLTPAPNIAADVAEGPMFRIVDAVYGPPLGEAMPLAYNHRLPQELQRRCAAQLGELLVRPLFLPAGSLNSIFSDPAPLITKELRIAVASPRNEVHVATFNEYEDIRFTTLEFLWKQSPPLALQRSAHPEAHRDQGANGQLNNGGSSGGGRSAAVVGARRGGRGGWEWASSGPSLAFCSGAAALRPSLAAHAPKDDDDANHPKTAPPPLVATTSAAAVNDALEFGGTLPPELLQKKPRREVTLAPAVVPGMDSAAMVDWRLKYRAFRCGDYSGAAEYSDGCGSSPEKGRNFRSWRWGHSRYAAAAAASAASKGNQRAWTIVDLTQASGAKHYSKRTAKDKDSRTVEHKRTAKEAQAKRPRGGLSSFSAASTSPGSSGSGSSSSSSSSSNTSTTTSAMSLEKGISSSTASSAPMSTDQGSLSTRTAIPSQSGNGNRVGTCVGGSGHSTLVNNSNSSSSSSSGLAGGLGGSFREETILSALVDHLGFLERVACSVCSTTWHGVFYFAGACRAVHTLLPVFHNCSRTFLLGALEHSVRSLVTCGLVNRTDLTPDDFHAKVLPLSGLRVLDLTNCIQLDASCFHGIANHLSNLEVLLLKELPNLDDEGLTAIVASCQHLKVVDVSGCPRLTGAAVTAVGVHCKHLRMCTLAFLKFTGQEMAHLLLQAGASSLHTFSLRDCHLVTTLGDVAVDLHLPLPPPSPGSRPRRGANMGSSVSSGSSSSGSSSSSSSSSSSTTRDASGQSGEFFFARHSSSSGSAASAAASEGYDNNNESEEFSGGASVSSSTESVAAGGYNGGFGTDSASDSSSSDRGSLAPVLLPQALPAAKTPFAPLTCINLSGCHNLVDSALLPLRAAINLRDVNLAHCHRLTDATLILLGQRQHLLQFLDCSCWTLLTDKGLASCTGRFPHLRSLALDHCRQLTTPAVLRFVLCCPRLLELRLPYCKLVNARMLAHGVEPPHRRTTALKLASKRIKHAKMLNQLQQPLRATGLGPRQLSADAAETTALGTNDDDDEDAMEHEMLENARNVNLSGRPTTSVDIHPSNHPSVPGARGGVQPSWYPGDISSVGNIPGSTLSESGSSSSGGGASGTSGTNSTVAGSSLLGGEPTPPLSTLKPFALTSSRSVPALRNAVGTSGNFGSIDLKSTAKGAADHAAPLAPLRSNGESYSSEPLAPYLDLMDLRGCQGLEPSTGTGSAVKPLGIAGFKEPRPGFLRRLPPRVYAGVDKSAWQRP